MNQKLMKKNDGKNSCKKEVKPFKSKSESIFRLPGKVLIIDDEPLIVSVTKKTLNMMGCETITSCDGGEGIQAFRSSNGEVGVVLLDVRLPDMDTADVIRDLTSINENIPIVLFSGYELADVEYLFEIGAKEYLPKPISIPLIKEVLGRLFPQES
jgi:CheY-like chemotaxis protein